MSHKPIIVGVDVSSEAASAAQFGVRVAKAAGAPCRLVHAVRDVWLAGIPAEIAVQATEFTRALQYDARLLIGRALEGRVSRDVLDALIIESGRPAAVITDVAMRSRAELIVLGGKHHSAIGRWLSGSTSLNVARTATIPTLVTAGQPGDVRRVLVAVDASAAAGPTLDLAHHYATLFDAELRVLSVLEPLPVLPEGAGTPVDTTQYYELCREMLQRELTPRLEAFGGTLMLRHGTAVDTILREATLWPADVLVVGSHGKNWAQRLMLGSVTEKVLNYLPTSVLVAPVGARQPVAEREPVIALEAVG